MSLATFERRDPPQPSTSIHCEWELMRVLCGHNGWVRSLAVDPIRNDWFASGSADSTIKIWDLASGSLRLTLTGHINSVRSLCLSSRHPYLFSAGDDRMIKCWDLEQNRVVRSYHGHLGGVYSIDLHPTLDCLVSGSRDGSVRLWDMRSRQCIHTYSGHSDSVLDVKCSATEPQLVSSSQDTTVRVWDLPGGRCYSTITHHKKSIRAISINPEERSFAACSADRIAKYSLEEQPRFMSRFEEPSAPMIVNCSTPTLDGRLLVTGSDDGALVFWDWQSGKEAHRSLTKALPGSLDSERSIYCAAFDMSGTRLLTGEGDKSIKVWRESSL